MDCISLEIMANLVNVAHDPILYPIQKLQKPVINMAKNVVMLDPNWYAQMYRLNGLFQLAFLCVENLPVMP